MLPPVDLDQLAARALARGSREPSHRSRLDADTVDLVAGAIRARKHLRLQRRIAVGGAVAVAAAVALAIGVVSRGARAPVAMTPAEPPRAPVVITGQVDSVVGDAQIVGHDGRRAASGGSPLSVGDELVVQRGAQVAFLLSTGTRIAVEEGSDVAVVEQGPTQSFRLSSGSLRAEVHKLLAGERFLVRTPDAEIEVRGTSFRVAMDPSGDSCGGSATRVQVYEGVVTVRAGANETRVAAGETWPSGCSSAVATALSPSPTTQSTTVVRAATSSSPRTIERSQLADQNDLYGRALTAREAGDAAGALVLFERLVARYPSGPLAENASAERLKLLATGHRPEASQAAADYLARYPAGFARRDAEEIVARERRKR